MLEGQFCKDRHVDVIAQWSFPLHFNPFQTLWRFYPAQLNRLVHQLINFCHLLKNDQHESHFISRSCFVKKDLQTTHDYSQSMVLQEEPQFSPSVDKASLEWYLVVAVPASALEVLGNLCLQEKTYFWFCQENVYYK